MNTKLEPIEVLRAQCEAQGVEFVLVGGDFGLIQMTLGDWRLDAWTGANGYRVWKLNAQQIWHREWVTDERTLEAINGFLGDPVVPQAQPVSWAVTAGGYSFKCESVQAAEWLATALKGK